MGKYNNLKVLEQRGARVNHRCNLCGHLINIGEFYYSEEIKDKFLHSLHRKKFCKECVERFKKQLPPIVN